MRKLEVYKITNNKNGKIYVGITNQGANTNRWYKHCSDANVGSTFPLHNAIRKYGKENFQIEVIEIIDNEDFDYLKEREIYWIKELNSYNRKIGYNLTLGGDGTFGRFHSEETKDKIRQKAMGRKLSEETKNKISKSHKLLEYDHDEMSKRAKKGNDVRWSNPNARKQQSINNPRRRHIIKYDLELNFIAEYCSVEEASISIEKSHGNIAACARGKLKTAYGYIWKYKNDKP